MARATLNADGDKIVIETLFREKDLVKQIPGAGWSAKLSAWHAPLSWGTCVILRGIFGANLEIADDLAAWAQHELETRVYPANQLREAIDAVGSSKLFGYQRAGVQFLKAARRALLCDGLGAGKTRQALMTAMAHYQAHLEDPDNYPNPFPILAVVPNSTKTGWKREAGLVWPGLEVQVVKGSAAKRREQLETPAHMYVINWEGVRGHSRLKGYGNIALKRCKECGGEDLRISHKQCEVHPRELNQVDFGMVIADECFLGHVLVDTPHGKRTVSSLKPGDEIYGYDHATGEVIATRVTATMNRPAAAVVAGYDATPNHPYFVVDQGYRRLGDLAEGDRLYELDLPGVYESGEDRAHDMRKPVVRVKDWAPSGTRFDGTKITREPHVCTRIVPGAVCRQDHEPTHVLQQSMRQQSSDSYVGRSTSSQESQRRNETCNCADSVLRDTGLPGSSVESVREIPLGAVRGQGLGTSSQPSSGVPAHARDESREAGRAVAHIEATLATHGIWTTLDEDDADGSGVTRALAGIGAGLAAEDGGQRGAAELLHTGHHVPGAQADRGSGRLGAPWTPGVRRAPDPTIGSSRVRRHEVLELRSVERYARVCAESSLAAGETQTVYSLTTETGNYFANGVLVSNCHRMKDPSAKQTRAVWAATGDAPYRYGLTGTPIANAPDDLWAILHWLDPEEWPSRVRYIDRFAMLQYNAFGAPIVTGLKPETKDEFFRIVNPRMRRMPKELVLSYLPPVIRERRDVEMSPKQKKAYEDMRDKMVAELNNGDILTAPNPLTKMTRLIQFSSSYAELEEFTDATTGKQDVKVRLVEPSCKLDAFMADMPDFGDDSVVVFAQSRQLIYLLHERLEKEGIPHGLITGMQNEDERQQAIDDFQNGKTKYILATMGAGGTGITLTAARIAVYLQRSWSLIENEQSEGRVHRIGSEVHDSIIYIDYVTTDSVEELQHMAVAAKFERLEEILRDKDLMKRALVDNSVIDYLAQDVHDAAHNDGGTEVK